MLPAGGAPGGELLAEGGGLLGGVALLERELVLVVFFLGIVWVDGFVEEGVAQGVGAFFPVGLAWPVAVFGDGDGAAFSWFVGFDSLHGVVVDEEVSAVVSGECDAVVFVAEDDVDDVAVVAGFVFPAVGEQTLKNLVAEAKATESRRRARVRTVLTGSYSHHYRVMLPNLLDALEFRCNNTAYRPVMEAVELLHRYKDRDGRFTHYERAERVPLDGVVKAEWRGAVVDDRGRVERVSYELCVLGALRDAVRRREIWAAGAKVWRDPEADLPVDFDLHRDMHYTAIARPTRPDRVRG